MTVRTGAMAEDGKSTEATPELKEWSPLHHLTLQVPAKYQNLLVTGDLQLTCVSAVDEHILLGTNTGSVYWYDCVTCAMERYRSEGQLNPVCRVSAVTSSDHLLAAGHRSGDVSLFLVPRLARGQVPEYVRVTERNIKKSLQFSVQAKHQAPISALAWSQNAARLFSGDEAGTVVVTEINYITESVTSRVVLREPSAIVQLQFSRQTLLVAARDRSCLLAWPNGEPRQVGTKPRKSPAALGACFVEGEAGLTVLAARASLKVVTAGLDGQVSSTISLKPTLETAGSVQLLYPVSVPAPSGLGPGRLLPLWPGAVALYDAHTLLVLDVDRWEIVWRCDRLPAVLDVAAAGGAIFVLCSGRRLVRLAETADNHPAICENLRLANGDLSFDDVMQDLKSAVPITQVKSLISSVSGQLERSGLLDALSSKADAVSSLTSRVSSLVTGRLGSVVSREPRRSALGAAASSPDVSARLGGASSSPDVRDADLPAEETAGAPADDEPIARQVRSRRRPGRRARAARGASVDVRSLDTVSLGGEGAAAATNALRRVSTDERPVNERVVDERVVDERVVDERVVNERVVNEQVVNERVVDERIVNERVVNGRPSDQRPVELLRCAATEPTADNLSGDECSADERRSEQRTPDERRTGAARPDELCVSDGADRSADGPRTEHNGTVLLPTAPPGPLDFTQFYPSELRPSLQKSDSQLEEEQHDKERRLAALLGLEDLSPSSPPPAPPAAATAASRPVRHCRDLFGIGTAAAAGGLIGWGGGETAEGAAREEAAEPDPGPSFHSLFAFGEKPVEAARPPPPRPSSADSETGEPRREVAVVRPPSAPASPSPEPTVRPPSVPASPSPEPTELEVATEGTEGTPVTEPAAAGDWRPWDRQPAPSFVMTLAACARYAVLTDPDGRVYCSPAAGQLVWEQLDYTACQVSVSYDGCRVWRLDQHGVAYSLADPEPGRPRGSHWVKAARDVVQLAADSAAVWYIKRGGRLFVQRDLSAHRCASPEFAVDTPDQVIHVTAREGVVWAVTAKGSVLWRVGVTRAQLAGFGWEPLSMGPLTARTAYLTAGEAGWLLDDRGRLHVTTGVSAALPRGMDGVWRRVLGLHSSSSPSGRQVAVMAPGAALRSSLAVEGDVAWFTEPGIMNVTTCRRHIIGVRWEQFTPRGRELVWAEVHAAGLYQRRGQLWAVSAKGQLYGGTGHDGDLQVVPLPERCCNVACLAASPGTLWLLTSSGDVFVREGVEQSPRGTDWVQLDLMQIDGCRLVHLSVGAQSVWACDAAGRVLVRLGPTVARRSATGLQPAWVTMDQPPGVRFTLVCVGPADQPVWALDSAGVPWRRCGLGQQPVVGTHWQATVGLTAYQLAISPSAVWARASSGLVHRWMEAGREWCRVPGSTRHVSASVSGELWVVHRGGLFTLHDLALRPGRTVTPRVRTESSSDTEDRDWELVTC